MNKYTLWIIAASLALAAGGCATSPKTAHEGQAVFAALQQAVAGAGKKAEPSLALVKIERSNAPTTRSAGRMTITMGGSSDAGPSSGLILTRNGHILVPGVIKLDQDKRIAVLVGENEYVGRSVKADETLGMSILKLDSEETFNPLDISSGADLAIGEWAVVLMPTDEDSDYQKLSVPAVCQGKRTGRYRGFLLNESLSSSSGALVVNLKGQIIGIVEKNTVLAINDLREDLQRFLADATGESLPDDEKNKKGWFGAMLQPVNKDYAKARKLSPSSLLVLHAAKDGPAAAAGVRDGDLITALNGKPIRLTGSRALDYFMKSLRPRTGEKFTVTVLRDNKLMEFNGTFAKAPEPETLRAEDLGVTVTGITDNDLFSHNLSTDHGVFVSDVHRGSPAANSGTLRQTLISKNDVIVELAGQPTPTVAAFGRALETIRREHPPVVLVKYYRGLLTGYAGLNLALGEKENENKQ